MTMISKLIRTSALTLVASGFALLAVPAHATEADQAPQGELKVTGIDFSSAKEVDRVIARLHRVALDICVPGGSFQDMMKSNARDCYDKAIKTGMVQIRSRQQEAMRASGVHVAAAQPVVQPHN